MYITILYNSSYNVIEVSGYADKNNLDNPLLADCRFKGRLEETFVNDFLEDLNPKEIHVDDKVLNMFSHRFRKRYKDLLKLK